MTKSQIPVQGFDCHTARAAAFSETELVAGSVLADYDRLWPETVPNIPVKSLDIEACRHISDKLDIDITVNGLYIQPALVQQLSTKHDVTINGTQ